MAHLGEGREQSLSTSFPFGLSDQEERAGKQDVRKASKGLEESGKEEEVHRRCVSWFPSVIGALCLVF